MNEQQTADLPPWTKPLDTVENCAERVDTDDFAFDWDQYLAALTFLTERRQELPFDMEFAVPQGEHFLSRTTDPKWDRVVSLTEDRCGCGQHRHISGGAKPAELAGDDKVVVVPLGKAVDLVPRGLHRRQTIMRISIIEVRGQVILTHRNRPYTATVNFDELLNGPKGYLLNKLEEHVAKHGPARFMEGKERPLCDFTVDATAMTVTVRPNVGIDLHLVEA
ncbi:MAG TPA: hypothetical protein VL283_02085 [Candidatus Baltobacteraceae bacterium]|nr:hypothetical protein [Candidatus Baltobacteraceae bacterium]